MPDRRQRKARRLVVATNDAPPPGQAAGHRVYTLKPGLPREPCRERRTSMARPSASLASSRNPTSGRVPSWAVTSRPSIRRSPHRPLRAHRNLGLPLVCLRLDAFQLHVAVPLPSPFAASPPTAPAAPHRATVDLRPSGSPETCDHRSDRPRWLFPVQRTRDLGRPSATRLDQRSNGRQNLRCSGPYLWSTSGV